MLHSMKLAALSTGLVCTLAWAGLPSSTTPDPCGQKAADYTEACSAQCFKADPNKKDQSASKGEQACMKRCMEKASKVSERCRKDAKPRQRKSTE